MPLIASFPHLYPTHPLAFLALIPLIVDPCHQSLRRQDTTFLPARMKIYIKRHMQTWARTSAKQRVPRDAGHAQTDQKRVVQEGWGCGEPLGFSFMSSSPHSSCLPQEAVSMQFQWHVAHARLEREQRNCSLAPQTSTGRPVFLPIPAVSLN